MPHSLPLSSHTSPQVRAAYSSGNPALGVGAGNTPAVIDETADIQMAVSSILVSKVGRAACKLPVRCFGVRQQLQLVTAGWWSGQGVRMHAAALICPRCSTTSPPMHPCLLHCRPLTTA